MKIVDYETFIRMPAGTVFCTWNSDTHYQEQKWEIKIDEGWTIGYDDSNSDDWVGKINTMLKMCGIEPNDDEWEFNGVCPLEFCAIEGLEDGCYLSPLTVGEYETEELCVWDTSSADYEKDQLFCVLNIKELDDMIGWLQWARKQMKKEGE